MKKKNVLASLVGAVVLSLSAYGGYCTYDAYVNGNESNLLLENIEALTQNEASDDGRIKARDNDEPCTIVETYPCKIGVTIPDWVPYVGGTTCEWSYQKEVKFPGTQNLCEYTGKEEDYCHFYRCIKN